MRELLRSGWCYLILGAFTLSLALFASPGQSHELEPTIADLTIIQGALELDLRLNIEAQLSGIDLDALSDTNAAPDPRAYDDLRDLSTAELERLLPNLLGRWNATGLIRAGGIPIKLVAGPVTIPENVTAELPRLSRWRLTGALPAGATEITLHWPVGSGAMVLRQQGVEDPFTGFIQPGSSSPALGVSGGGALTGWQSFASYIPVGFDHILPKGLDHILFVLGLFFLSTRMRPLIFQITAFTLAHTITLAMGSLGWVAINPAIVEPLIALSIVYVAVENLFMRGLSPWRPLVIFGFGLLHGLGFASVLGDFGLPQGGFIPALVGFNIGVELGQLAVIAIAAALLLLVSGICARIPALSRKPFNQYTDLFRATSIPVSLWIAAIGAYWSVERVFF